jgi:hypothetical protein
LKTFTKAFQHFFQKPGTLTVFAFVVIAFQDFGFLWCQSAGRDIESFAPLAQSSKASQPAPRLALVHVDNSDHKTFRGVETAAGSTELNLFPERALATRS